MTPQRGPFITGLVSFRVEDLPTFHADVNGFNLALETAPIVRTKRDDVWRRVRQGTPGAGLILHGRVKFLGFPLPDQFKGVTGEVVLKYHQTAKATIQIRVLSSSLGVASKTDQDTWDISFTCEVTAMPALTGWNRTQKVVSQAVAYNAAETHEGISKAIDPDTLQDLDTVRYDLEGLLDTHADETAKIVALLAAQVATRSAMKVRSAQFTRTDPWGGVVVITLMRTTTGEDVENAGTIKTVDPKKLQTGGTVTKINVPAPALPTVAGQTIVRRVTSQQELNDGNQKYTSEYGQRDTKDDVEMPGTVAKVDVSGMESVGQDTAVYDTAASVPANAASPHSTLQAIATAVQELNQDESQKITYFSVNTPAENWVYERTRVSTDPYNLKNVNLQGAIFVVGSEPSPPGTPTGLVYRDKVIFTVASPNTSNLQGVIWTYAEVTTADDEILPRSRTRVDPSYAIKSEKISGEIVVTGAASSAPTAPDGLKFTGHTDIPLTNAAASNQTLRLYSWAKLDSLDELRLPKQKTTVDGGFLEDEAVRTKEWLTNATPPSGPSDPPTNNVKLITYTDLTITPIIGSTPGLMLRVFLYGPRNSRDERVLPNTETITDDSDLQSTAIRAYLDGEAVPSTPAGLVLRDTKVRPQTVLLGTNRTLTVLIFGKLTHKQEIELLQSRSVAEPGNVAKTEIVVKVLTTATPVTDNTYNPDTTNLEFWTDEVHQVTGAGTVQYVHVITYKPLSPLNDAQESFKQIVDDPVTVLVGDDRRRVIDANATTAAPVVTAVGTGQAMVCNHRLTTKIGHTLYQHDFWYAFRSLGDQLEADKTRTLSDVGALRHLAVTADVFVAGSPPADPSAPASPTGLKLVDKEDLELANPLYQLRVYRWGLQTSKDEVEQRNTRSIYGAVEPPRIITASVVSHAGTAAALAATLRTTNANASPTTFDGVEVEKLNDNLALQKIVETPNYLIYEINSFSGRQTVNAFLIGGAVYVRLDRVIQRGTSLYDVLIQPQTRIVRRATIALRRKKIGDPLALNILKQGLVNSELLLGLPIGEVMYRGPRAVTDLAITGGRGADVVDVFEFCSLGWYSEEGVITGWFPTTADLSTKDDGDNVSAATFGWTQAVGTAATPMIDFITP